MAEVTHIKLIFPLAFDMRHAIKTFWDEENKCHAGAVLHQNAYWRDDQVTPNYAPNMDVWVGVERASESNIWGEAVPCPASGILRGEYLRFDPVIKPNGSKLGGWGWLVFRLRYDMQENIEAWDLQSSGYQVYTSGQAGNFYYMAEMKDAE